MRNSFLLISLFILWNGCKDDAARLPILGNVQTEEGDTIYQSVEDIILIDQDSQFFQLSKNPDKIFIGDFFFTSCPSICPTVTRQMMRIYEKYIDDNRVMLLSHTIDPRHDSVTVLKRYANNLSVASDKWKFLYAARDSVFKLADSYFVSVQVDSTAPGGFDHSGKIILVDEKLHVRGFCDGTSPETVTAFFKTVDKLLKDEYAP